jgi:hypothetical protein
MRVSALDVPWEPIDFAGEQAKLRRHADADAEDEADHDEARSDDAQGEVPLSDHRLTVST